MGCKASAPDQVVAHAGDKSVDTPASRGSQKPSVRASEGKGRASGAKNLPGQADEERTSLRTAGEGRQVTDDAAPPAMGGSLKISVMSAKGLRATTGGMFGGTSDSYCIVQLRGKPDSRVQTQTIAKTCSPVWDEDHVIDEFGMDDIVDFAILDQPKGKAPELLGQVSVGSNALGRSGFFEGELRLVDTGDKGKATIKVRIELEPDLPDAPPVSTLGCRLRVTVLSASGLRAADWALGGGKSDPFVVCQFKGKPDSKFETRHIDKTLEPVWYEEHDMDDYELGDLLEFTVLDYDRGSSADLLGRATLASKVFDREGGFDGELRLKECGKGHNATLKIRVAVLPPATPDAPPVSQPGSKLLVSIISASGLRAADWSMMGGKSDPYCVGQLQDNPDSMIQTRYIKKTLEPAWEEQHEIEDYVRGVNLEFIVFDYDMGKAHDRLGKVVLPGREFDRDGGFDGELRLKESGQGCTATLRVKVIVLPPDAPNKPPVSVTGSRLKITVHSAKGLRAADMSLTGGKSDPFCCCELVGKPDSLLETKHIMSTLEPEWEDVLIMDEFDRGDELEFRVMDWDRMKSADLLGRITLATWKFDREGGFAGTLKLKDCGKGKKATLKVTVEVLPPELPDAPPVSEPGCRLRILLRGATGLRAADWSVMGGGKSDPYCICQCPGKSDTVCETKFVSKTLDPVWDEEHQIDDYVRGDPLEFVIMDHDIASKDDLLGKVTLPCRNFDRDGGYEGLLRLKQAGKGSQAKLAVQVLVLPADKPDKPPVSQPGSRLKVKLHSAIGLRAADVGGKSDPYACCMIPMKPDTILRTAVVTKCLTPIWQEEFEIDEYDPGDNLDFWICDSDKIGTDDGLGWYQLKGFMFDRDGGFEGELRLRDSGKGRKAYLRVQISVLPPLRPPAPPISELGSRIMVTFIGARGLRSPTAGMLSGSANPYATCQILGKPDFVRSRAIKKTSEPTWDEPPLILPDYTLGDCLELSVRDQDKASPLDLLGRTKLACRDFDRAGGFDGELWLKKPTGRPNTEAFIRVKIDVLPSLETELRLKAEAEREAARMAAELRSEQNEREMMSVADDESWKVEEAIREKERLEQEERDREAERKAKEDAKLKAAEDAAAAVRAAADAKIRKQLEGKEVVVPLHFSLEEDAFAEVKLPYGSNGEVLRQALFDTAKLPFMPRLVVSPDATEQLPADENLIDAGVKEDEPVIVEAAAALTSSKDNTAKVWNALTGECMFTLKGSESPVTAVCATPDLKWVVTSSEDMNVKVWVVDSAAGSVHCLWTMTGHEEIVNSVAYSKDGKWIVTASEDSTARIWSVRTGQCKRTFEGHFDAVLSASFTPDGQRIITQSRDKTIKYWEVETGRCEMTEKFEEEGSVPLHVTLTALHEKMSITSEGPNGFITYAGSGGFEHTLEGHTDEITCATLVDIRVPTVRLTSPKTAKVSAMNKLRAMHKMSMLSKLKA